MREIKFKAWDKKNKKMIEVFNIHFEGNYWANNGINVEVFDAPPSEHHIPFEQIDLLQYIGTKDINGIEVYEGDIVEVDDRQIGGKKYIGEVYYCSDYTLETNPCFAVWANGHAPLSCSIKVLGNIYENKELLKGGE